VVTLARIEPLRLFGADVRGIMVQGEVTAWQPLVNPHSTPLSRLKTGASIDLPDNTHTSPPFYLACFILLASFFFSSLQPPKTIPKVSSQPSRVIFEREPCFADIRSRSPIQRRPRTTKDHDYLHGLNVETSPITIPSASPLPSASYIAF
jgi:hypothetical protein